VVVNMNKSAISEAADRMPRIFPDPYLKSLINSFRAHHNSARGLKQPRNERIEPRINSSNAPLSTCATVSAASPAPRAVRIDKDASRRPVQILLPAATRSAPAPRRWHSRIRRCRRNTVKNHVQICTHCY
jgi:hypothetical protein